MNHLIVLFEDEPEMSAVREQLFVDHLTYLTAQPHILVDGASLAPNGTAKPVGGLWIVNAVDRDSIVRLIEGDPLFRSGHRTFRIFSTGKQLSVS
ncbi:YciI family protein [Ruegeria sp. HKCCA0235A]|uniref:YciI family protein n=1 Tax=Ruegeria sp. HKCCA0235A TaxID=2682998 RepID=UPI001488DB1C|nr:YciI family protein [Ruegeria sp. HKCCA0235A]